MPGVKSKKPAPVFREGYELPDFLRDDAFGLRGRMTGTTHAVADSVQTHRAARRSFRRKCLIMVVLCVIVAFFSLCFSLTGAGSTSLEVYSPLVAWGNLINWAVYSVTTAFGVSVYPEGQTLIDVAPLYAQVVPRAGMTLATLVCGALLACAGMLYQTVFRNPIVSPSLLGITHGVQVGFLFLFGAYGVTATELIAQRFEYGYIGGIVTLIVVFALSKLITRRKSAISVFDILVVGTIMSAFLGALREYLLDMLNAFNLWLEFFEFQEGLDLYYDPTTYAVLIASVIVAFVPIFLMRFRLNLLSFSDGEVRVMGSNPRALRALSIIAGSLMILTAQVFVGSASCFALVIPFLARYLFGSEFRHQLWGNVLLGMLILMICRIITIVVPFIGVGLPIGVVAGVLTLPVFVWASTLSRKGW